ncbi:MAG: DDE-type integrase/transposase/recombinase, partial [Desulfobulbaceae bacterium]|nr:DDE-type integrase/transposase/recombinase [Desulfobulbaceae bacterium]
DGSPGKTKPIGIINIRATFKRRSAEFPLYIVDDSCLQVIGLNQMSLLGMQINTAMKLISSSQVNYNPPSVEDLLSELSSKHSRLFSDGIGLIPNISHRIQLKPDARPVKMKERQVPFAMQDSGKRALDKLLEEGVVKKADKSEWVHPLHLVGKPDGDARPTVDFSRRINKWVIPSIHPLPCAKDIFQKIGKFKFFSKLDISSAYHHIALDADSQPLTTFISPWHGLLMYDRVPMGLTDLGDAFQKAIDSTLSGLEGVFAYADDVLIGGSTREEHDFRLREVMQRLDQNNFRLKKPKLVIAQQKVTMLGHLISASESQTTICPDPKNVESILKLPVPQDIHGVRQFLGACQFFADSMGNFAELSEPLNELNRKNVVFKWSDQCQTAFDTIKQQIASPKCMVPFEPSRLTYLTTDASQVGLGALLSQVVDGKERPVSFAHKTLNEAQRNYSTPEREALAVVWATEHFEKFLLGRRFTLRTDQISLKTLMTQFADTRTSKRIARWRDRLQHHTFDVEHIKGKENCCADMLSRLSSENQSSSEPALSDDNDSIIVASLALSSQSTMEEIASASKSDPVIQKIKKYMVTAWPSKNSLSGDIRVFFKHRDELSVFGDCLFLGERLVIPAAKQDSILQILHTGHPGRNRMQQKYNESYFWPGGGERSSDFVRNCNACSLAGKNSYSEPVKTTAVPPPKDAWSKVAIDITGPFWTAPMHHQNIVILSDYYSKYPEIMFTHKVTSTKIISWLKEVFARFGNPNEVVSDNGPQFTSCEFTAFLASRNIKHQLIARYNPPENGLVEVFNRSLKKGAQVISCSSDPKFKDGILDLVESFRATAPEHGESPFKLLLGYCPRTTSDVRNPLFMSGGDQGIDDYFMSKKRASSHMSKEQKDKVVQDKFVRRRYGNPAGCKNPSDSNSANPRPVPRHPYQVGQKVMTKRPQAEIHKGQTQWSAPKLIKKIVGRWTYQLEDGSIWNARKLRRFQSGPSRREIEEHHLLQTRNHHNQSNHSPLLRRSGRSGKGQRRQRLISES